MRAVPNKLRVAGPARRDIVDILRWSGEQFGAAAALRYDALIRQALCDLRTDPNRPGSRERPDLMASGARTYHLFFSRDHVSGDRVKQPRHFLLYRVRPDGVIEVARILHDSRDLERHLPEDYKAPSAWLRT